MLLLAPAYRVVDADLGRVDVDHSPRHGPVEHLAERLRCFEAIARREVHPPGGYLLRCQLADAPVAEHRQPRGDPPIRSSVLAAPSLRSTPFKSRPPPTEILPQRPRLSRWVPSGQTGAAEGGPPSRPVRLRTPAPPATRHDLLFTAASPPRSAAKSSQRQDR